MLTLSTPLLAPQLVAALWPSLSLPDARLAARLERSVEHLLTRWDGPSGLRGRTAQRGWTRFCNNPRVDTTTLFRAATDQTIRAIANVKVLVLAHDTSEIDKHGRAEPDDAGPLRSVHSRGYLLHGCTAIDLATGARLGVLDAMAWTRSWKLRKQDHGTRAPHKKESIKWRRGLRRADAILRAVPSLQVVFHAMDREGDVHENFAYALRHKVTIVARAEHDRRVQGPHGKLFAHLEAQPCVESWDAVVPNRVNAKARKAAAAESERALARFDARVRALGAVRTATLELRFASVTLAPDPEKHRTRRPLALWAVFAREVDAPAEVDPLEWMLWTTYRVEDARAAKLVVHAYLCRWGCEDLHKLIKTGLHLEGDPVEGIASFRRQLSVVLPVATHLMQWSWVAREMPGAPAAAHVPSELLDAARDASVVAKLPVTRRPRTVREFVVRLAELGGYERGRGTFPGWLTIWRGWKHLQAFREILAFAEKRRRKAPS